MSSAQVLKIKRPEDIPASYRGTPVERLLLYQNFNHPHDKYQRAQLLIGMCIDYRKHLNIPENFAYIIRAGGANLKNSQFKVSFSIAVGGVSTIALIGHTRCGMVGLESQRQVFIEGLMDRAGWSREQAERHFNAMIPLHEIHNEADFVLKESKRLQAEYPKIHVAPLLYDVDDQLLYLVQEVS